MKAALPIVFCILAYVVYHASQKLTSQEVNPFLSLAVSFGLASVLCGVGFLLTRTGAFSVELGKVSWTAAGVGVAVVVIETAYLMAYRYGWQVSVTSLLVSVGQTAVLIPLGYLMFSEKFTGAGILGAALSLAGLVLVSFQARPH